MTPRERFTKLVESTLDPSAPETPEVTLDQCLLDVEGRSFHLGLSPERSEITFSTLVFYTDREPDQIYADLIADFNAYHLFRGGYRLSVDPDTLCLYVSVTRSLDGLESGGLSPFFADFIDRCVTCTRWYMDESARRIAEADMPESAMVI